MPTTSASLSGAPGLVEDLAGVLSGQHRQQVGAGADHCLGGRVRQLVGQHHRGGHARTR